LSDHSYEAVAVYTADAEEEAAQGIVLDHNSVVIVVALDNREAAPSYRVVHMALCEADVQVDRKLAVEVTDLDVTEEGGTPSFSFPFR
jgi:hypothetical protein